MEVNNMVSQMAGLAAGGDVVEKFKVAETMKASGDEAFKKGNIPEGMWLSTPTYGGLYVLTTRGLSCGTSAFRNYHSVSISLRHISKTFG